MIIRSQDKYSIINFDNIDRVRLSEYRERGEIKAHYQTDIYYLTKNEAGLLGTYSTEEKAIKVLDMICAEYQYAEECKHTGVGSAPPEFVFQMPSDKEVEV